MDATPSNGSRTALSTTLIAAGAVLGAVGLAADAIGIGFGKPGLGKGQLLAAVVGVLAIGAGIWVAPARRQWAARSWSAAAVLTPAQVVLLGAWIGVVVGFVEVGHQAIRKYGFGTVLKQPVDLVWMLPAAYLVAFAAAGVVLAVFVAVAPRVFRLPVVMFALVAPGVWAQFLMHGFFDPGAVILLTIGAAVQAARVATTRWESLRRLVRRTLPLLIAAVVVLGVGITWGRSHAESRAREAVPAVAEGTPNVLLIVLDTVRADHMGLHGYSRDTTPNIDQLASSGTMFERVFTTSPWTLPSHASMFTGHYPHRTGVNWLIPLDGELPTLAEVMSANGYVTAGFVGNITYCCGEQGLDRGFSRYEDFYLTPAVIAHTTSLGRRFIKGLNFFGLIRNDAPTITNRFLEWLDSTEGRPFFAFLNYFDAHGIYDPPAPFDTEFGPRSPILDHWYVRPKFSDDEMVGFVDAYDGCIKAIDASLGELFGVLDERGLLDNTLVVITADHGEQFGEHGLKDHSNSLYVQLLHAPLVLRFPERIPSGRRVVEFASLRDLPATILGVLGITDHAIPGHSLAPLWANTPPAARPPMSPLFSEVGAAIRRPDWEPISRGPMKALVDPAGLHYIRNGDGIEEIYDLATDPQAEHNLIETEAGRAAASRLSAEVEKIVR